MANHPQSGLKSDFVDGVDFWDGPTAETTTGYIESQLIGSLKSQVLAGGAVFDSYGPDAFKVSAGAGLSVNIAPGSGMAPSATYGAVVLERKSVSGAFNLADLPANTVRFVYAQIEVSDLNDSRKSGLPLFVVTESASSDNGILLAQITIGTSSVTVDADLRREQAPLRYLGAWDNAKQYRFNDAVSNGGQLWRAKRDNLNVTPVAGVDWELLVEKGADSVVAGPQGDPGVGVPTGGTTGQVLAKTNSTDYNTQWVTPSTTPADDSITDPKIGNRTIDDTLATPASTGNLGPLLSWIAGRLKAITGKSSWLTAPAITLEAAKSALDGKVGLSTIDAKGDLVVGTANDTIARLGVGANDTVLTADSTQTGGMAWKAASGGSDGSGKVSKALSGAVTSLDITAAESKNLNIIVTGSSTGGNIYVNMGSGPSDGGRVWRILNQSSNQLEIATFSAPYTAIVPANSTRWVEGDGVGTYLLPSPPTGSAGGDLTGTYPNPTLKITVVAQLSEQELNWL